MRTAPRGCRVALLAIAAVGGLLLSGCGDGAPDNAPVDASSVVNGIVGDQPDGGAPQSGGTLSYATYTSVTTLDPAARQDTGATGGSEMAAIYDLLVRYDVETHEYIPQLAESLTANDDSSVWTLRLRDGVTFSDGTVLDADAVISSIERYLANKGIHTQVWTVSVKDMAAADASTVEFTLQRPWTEFPYLLSTGPGMIVAPSAMATGELQPIGAGPYTVERHAPDDELVLVARPDYHGGAPYLDKLRFPAIVGSQGMFEALRAGGVQAAYLRAAEVVSTALDAGYPGHVYSADMGGVLLMNQRAGRASEDVRVRKAITAAIDPDLFNERALDGFGMPGQEMFQAWSQWHGDVKPSGFDPETATRLLAEAKADGYDGTLTFAGIGDSATQLRALAFQSMLQAVGFTVDIEYSNSVGDLTKTIYADRDFDIAYSAYTVLDASPFTTLFGHLQSASPINALGYANPEMDELLLDLQKAQGADGQRAVIDQIQALVNDTAPFVTVNAGKYFIPWAQNTHGITPSLDGIMLFDKAWIAQS